MQLQGMTWLRRARERARWYGKQIPLWLRVGLVIILLLTIWILHRVDSCYGRQNLTTGSIVLDPELQIKVDYPRRLNINDQGIRAGKKIIVKVKQTEQRQSQLIQISLMPSSSSADVIRFLTEQGINTEAKLPIVANYDTFSPGVLYVEHGNVPIPTLWHLYIPFDVVGTLPEGSAFKFFRLNNLFKIEVESPIASVIRDIGALFLAFAASFLAAIDPIRDWWKTRQKKFQNLYIQMRDQVRKGDPEKARELYNQYLDWMSLSFYPRTQIEELHGQIEAWIYYANAIKALNAGDRQEAASQLEVARKLIKPSKRCYRLQQLFNDLDSKDRARQAKALEALDRALEERDDLSTQIIAAIALIRLLEKARAERLLPTSKKNVTRWLSAFPTALGYNPFEIASAEGDRHLEDYFFEHPCYKQLIDLDQESVALFAGQGDGKTSCQRMLAKRYRGEGFSVIEYSDFTDLVTHPARISVEAHAQRIVQEALRQLDMAQDVLGPPDQTYSYRECIKWLARLAEGKRVYILVDMNTCAETQVHPRFVERLVRHLVGNLDLLDVPNLYLKLFLPASLRERLLKYGGFITGRIKKLDMEWTKDQLRWLLWHRLNPGQAKPEKLEKEDIVRKFIYSSWPEPYHLDHALVRKAQGSPRQLILLVNMLFQHRAQIWDDWQKNREKDIGEEEKKLSLKITDWAILLEHLVRQREMDQ